ncbi:hypothetical protein KEM56_002590 [Ascosphaera pollenicola]|nr:hypothetical protein KEM56_002590 [Ascosphaera pollenicola]
MHKIQGEQSAMPETVIGVESRIGELVDEIVMVFQVEEWQQVINGVVEKMLDE